jgi:hypothetical protein
MGNQTALTKRDLAELMKLLGHLQDRLESEIDCHRQPGAKMPSEPADAKIIRTAMAKWKRAEDMVQKLEAAWRNC